MIKIKDNNKSLAADLSLLFVAVIWGGGFVAVKDALNNITPLYMMSIRLIGAGLLMAVVFYKQTLKITKKDIINGSIIGIFLFSGFAAQTIGLKYTTASKQAFLTAVYVIIIPFLSWAVYRVKPKWHSITAAILSFIGIALLSLKSDMQFDINIGDWLTLLCAVLFAAHIVSVSYYAKKSDPIALSVVQMIFSGILSLICALIFEPKFMGINKDAAFSIFYLVVFSTMICFLIQNVAQKYTHPNHVGIILSLESVFGAILSIIFLHEVFTLNMVIGCVIIFLAIIIAETKLEFLFKKFS